MALSAAGAVHRRLDAAGTRVAGSSDLVCFSLITLANVGYGDLLPVTEIARTLAVFDATVGRFYIAVVVAVFVGMYAAQRRDP
jgi:hypothetical protein